MPARGALAALALSMAIACTHAQRAGAETAVAKALVSDQQENQIGLQVRQQLEQQQHVKYVTDPQVLEFVKSVTDRVLPLAQKDRPGVKWDVKVIDDPKTVNAFATPGGFLYVYSGLLLAADDPAEVAGVLSHEAGHVVARHSARQMVDAYGLEAITSLALGQNPGVASQLAAGVAGKGAMLANSRGDETEADEYGARYANEAGFDPHALITFFQKLQKEEASAPGVMKFLSDHPATPDRITHLEQYIAEHHLTANGGRQPGQLQALHAKLGAQPAPGAPLGTGHGAPGS